MKKFTFIFSILTIVLAGVMFFLDTQIEYSGGGYTISGIATAFLAVAIILAVQMYPSFGESKEAFIVSLVAFVGAALFSAEGAWRAFGEQEASSPLLFIGLGLVALSFLLCPCLCMQGTRRAAASIIGVAAAHESITISDIAKRTGASESVVSSALYDAIGKGKLSGQMVGDTFKRTGPATRVAPDAKILVICPYCGAKTEQGLAKCQKCNADL